MEQMVKKIVIEASSIDDAIRRISAELGVPGTRLSASVLSEGKGFLGIFGKKLQVEVTVKDEPEEERAADGENLARESLDFLGELLKLMELEARPQINDGCCLSIEGSDSAIVVGRYGDTLKAFEYLVNLCLREDRDLPRVRLDSDGYRERREQSLQRLAQASARKAIERGVPVRLEPMASWERRIIHIELKDHKDVSTESVGESPERKVVVLPKVNPQETRTRPRRRYRK